MIALRLSLMLLYRDVCLILQFLIFLTYAVSNVLFLITLRVCDDNPYILLSYETFHQTVINFHHVYMDGILGQDQDGE